MTNYTKNSEPKGNQVIFQTKKMSEPPSLTLGSLGNEDSFHRGWQLYEPCYIRVCQGTKPLHDIFTNIWVLFYDLHTLSGHLLLFGLIIGLLYDMLRCILCYNNSVIENKRYLTVPTYIKHNFYHILDIVYRNMIFMLYVFIFKFDIEQSFFLSPSIDY